MLRKGSHGRCFMKVNALIDNELRALRNDIEDCEHRIMDLMQQIESKDAEIARLREELKPFEELAKEMLGAKFPRYMRKGTIE